LSLPWGTHLDLARCVVSIGQHDTAQGFVVMAVCLHLLQRDLVVAGFTDGRQPAVDRELEVQTLDHLRTVLELTP
jgi:hypothetical protein